MNTQETPDMATLLAQIEALSKAVAQLTITGNAGHETAPGATKATPARKTATARKATPKKAPAPKVVRDVTKPRLVDPTKACDGVGIVVNGERVAGRTFALWSLDPKAIKDTKRKAIDGGTWLAIARDGLSDTDRDALVQAWVNMAPKSRASLATKAHKDAWIVTVK
jgi:hypothetical protein